MPLLQPKQYEYLWTDHDVNYIFVSCYLFHEFRKGDFVLIYDPRKNGVAFYLGRKDRTKFSTFGLKFFSSLYPKWEQRVKNSLRKAQRKLKQVRKMKKKIPTLSNDQLLKEFNKLVSLFQLLGGSYFFTEYFFLDKVERMNSRARSGPVITKRLKRMAFIKLKIREVLNQLYDFRKTFKPYVDEIGKRCNRMDLPWLSYEEINRLHLGENVPISHRQKQHWVLTKKNDWQIIQGDRAKSTIKKFKNYFSQTSRGEIRGVVANRGYHVGRVSNIRTVFSGKIIKELLKVRKGDVLVANTTGPEIMTACRKAGAIITDEGGITSHAAIVSRELNIPCIIGTKFASQVLKDGDRVEVDAERGIVRKLLDPTPPARSERYGADSAKSHTGQRPGARATNGVVRKV